MNVVARLSTEQESDNRYEENLFNVLKINSSVGFKTAFNSPTRSGNSVTRQFDQKVA